LYNFLYRLEAEQVIVVVATLGTRREGDKDGIYEIAKKLKRAGFLD